MRNRFSSWIFAAIAMQSCGTPSLDKTADTKKIAVLNEESKVFIVKSQDEHIVLRLCDSYSIVKEGEKEDCEYNYDNMKRIIPQEKFKKQIQYLLKNHSFSVQDAEKELLKSYRKQTHSIEELRQEEDKLKKQIESTRKELEKMEEYIKQLGKGNAPKETIEKTGSLKKQMKDLSDALSTNQENQKTLVEINLLVTKWVDDLISNTRYQKVLMPNKNKDDLFYQVLNTYYKESIGIILGKFVSIPAGTFEMGAVDRDSEAFSDELPRHRVTISKPFEMMETVVTNSMWRAFMDDFIEYNKLQEDHPAEGVSWGHAQQFAEKLTQEQDQYVYELPTEAEWEYAARGGKKGEIYFGGKKEHLADHGWFELPEGEGSHPVKQKQPNGYGLYDMVGNVYQWVEDYYGAYPTRPQTDPLGSKYHEYGYRAVRGCYWHSYARECRLSARESSPPDYGENEIIEGAGLRLVRRAKPR